MKIEAGERYVRLDGVVTGPLRERTQSTSYPFGCPLTVV